ncbi:MAG: hypothetical protein K9K38_09065 [Rhodoferax sp.]|nr:hypothetical protein [Rhodoferax sp.]MCF8209537.1 hypothetical protein [Rhodoferax sp.]
MIIRKDMENALPPGYGILNASNLMVPLQVARTLSNEARAAVSIWEALQAGDLPDGSEEPEQDCSNVDFEATNPEATLAQEDEDSFRAPVLNLNETQLCRLDYLIKHCAKFQSKVRYSGAQIVTEEEPGTQVLQLYRNGNTATIALSSNAEHTVSSRFGSAFVQSNPKKEQHRVLDLYVHACQKIPAFRQSTERANHVVLLPSKKPLPPAPIAYTGFEPPLKFDPPMLGKTQIKLTELSNALVLGSTGSGKTTSFIEPALHAMLQYRNEGKSATILIVDPKMELLGSVQRKLAELDELDRLVVIGQTGPVKYFDDGCDLTLEDRFAIVNRFVSEKGSGEDGRWQAMAERLILNFLRDANAFSDIVGIGLLECVAFLATDEVQYLHRTQWVALKKVLTLGMEDQSQLRQLCDLFDVLCMGVGLTKLDRPLSKYANLKELEQYFYNARSALLIVDILGGDDLETLLDMSVQRVQRSVEYCNITDLMERGAVIVFQPRKKASHNLVGAVLKSIFFRCAIERTDMKRSVGYFCDEAQRFITTDDESGEHAFLDRARAYRVNAILATQSMAALRAAIGGGGRSTAALQSLLVNTPTKVCFRTTDEVAHQTMRSFIPGDPGGMAHVLSARPPSSLQVGECYFSLGSTWGRSQYRLDGPAQVQAIQTFGNVQGERP